MNDELDNEKLNEPEGEIIINGQRYPFELSNTVYGLPVKVKSFMPEGTLILARPAVERVPIQWEQNEKGELVAKVPDWIIDLFWQEPSDE